jgi:hypothetical protein
MVGSITLKGGNANNLLLRFVAFGAIVPVLLIRYMLGIAGRMMQYHDKD